MANDVDKYLQNEQDYYYIKSDHWSLFPDLYTVSFSQTLFSDIFSHFSNFIYISVHQTTNLHRINISAFTMTDLKW